MTATVGTIENLDMFLSMIPDQPSIPGLLPGACDLMGNSSNSIVDFPVVENTETSVDSTEETTSNQTVTSSISSEEYPT